MPALRSERRRAQRGQRPSKSATKSTWGAATVIVVLLAAFAGAWWMGRQVAVPTDAETLCRTDMPPPVTHVVVLDVTDTLSDGERFQVLNEIERLRAQLPRFGLIEVYAIDSAAQPGSALISVCNPGRGEDMNGLYQNPAKAEQRWQQDFHARINQTLDDVVAQEDSSQSLIMESIRAIAAQGFGRTALDGSEKYLTVFSDLLQHAPGEYSQYSRPLSPYATFRESTYGHATRVNLSGVHLRVFYVERPSTHRLQDGGHQKFWYDYFQASGAVVESFKKIFGD